MAFTVRSSASRTPPFPRPRLEIVRTAALRCSFSSCPSSFSPDTKFSFGSNSRPLHCLSCCSLLWTGSDIVRKSARCHADVHAPNCCSQRTFVGQCRVVLKPSRRYMQLAPRTVQQEFGSNFHSLMNKTSRINIVSMTDATTWYSASPFKCARAFCLRDAEQSGYPSTSISKLGWHFLSLTFPVQSLCNQTPKVPHVGRNCSKFREHNSR